MSDPTELDDEELDFLSKPKLLCDGLLVGPMPRDYMSGRRGSEGYEIPVVGKYPWNSF
jgi:hypothetical protein